MKFLNRQLANQEQARSQGQPEMPDAVESSSHGEPAGHIHPNYRHWNWFKPGHQRAQ
jgi:hypothetical protein